MDTHVRSWPVGILALSALFGCAAPAVQLSDARPAGTPESTIERAQVPRASPAAETPRAAIASPESVRGVIAPSGASGGSLDRDTLVARAVSDASTRTGLAVDAIRVVQVDQREWSSSALGCEQPGLGYAQVITPGHLIVLDAGGRMLEYHTDHDRVELCPR